MAHKSSPVGGCEKSLPGSPERNRDLLLRMPSASASLEGQSHQQPAPMAPKRGAYCVEMEGDTQVMGTCPCANLLATLHF